MLIKVETGIMGSFETEIAADSIEEAEEIARAAPWPPDIQWTQLVVEYSALKPDGKGYYRWEA